jgi:hypothetical protein
MATTTRLLSISNAICRATLALLVLAVRGRRALHRGRVRTRS